MSTIETTHPTLVRNVQNKTMARGRAATALDTADREWRDAIKAAWRGGMSAVDIAHVARIHRNRVYQILGDTR